MWVVGLMTKPRLLAGAFLSLCIQFSSLGGTNRQLDVVDLVLVRGVGGLTRFLGSGFVEIGTLGRGWKQAVVDSRPKWAGGCGGLGNVGILRFAQDDSRNKQLQQQLQQQLQPQLQPQLQLQLQLQTANSKQQLQQQQQKQIQGSFAALRMTGVRTGNGNSKCNDNSNSNCNGNDQSLVGCVECWYGNGWGGWVDGAFGGG
jgi:hypothetical protein